MNWSTRIDRRWTATTESACALPMCMRTGCVCVGDVCQGSSWTFISRKFHPSLVHFKCEAAKRQNEKEKKMPIRKFDIFNFVGRLRRLAMLSCVLCCNRSDMLLYMFFNFFSRSFSWRARTFHLCCSVCSRGTCCLHFSVSFFSWFPSDHRITALLDHSTVRVTIYKQITNEWNVYK